MGRAEPAAPSSPAAAGSAPVALVRPHTRHELSALMGCRASVTVVGPADPVARERLITRAEWQLRDLEGRWSRFLPDSEISLLARAAGTPVPVSAGTRDLVRHLIEAHTATEGAFDPTLLPALVRHGYATSVLDPRRTTVLPTSAADRFDPREIEIDDDRGTVRLPLGGSLDPGGLGKGLAADLVVEELLARGAGGAMVEIGGDLRVGGRSPWGPAWRIDIEDPFTGTGPVAATPPLVVALDDGGVATSSRLHRQWRAADGSGRHHLLDPSTGRSEEGPVLTCTVLAAAATACEAFTKVPFAVGVPRAITMFEHHDVAALIAFEDGTAWTSSAWADVVADDGSRGVR